MQYKKTVLVIRKKMNSYLSIYCYCGCFQDFGLILATTPDEVMMSVQCFGDWPTIGTTNHFRSQEPVLCYLLFSALKHVILASQLTSYMRSTLVIKCSDCGPV
jgi:hypothetical protein